MIQSYQETVEVLSSNTSPIRFERDCIRTRSCSGCGGWLCHSEGSPLYKIVSGGKYKVSFNANVTSAAAGVIALGLFADGVLVPGTTVIAPVTTVGNYFNVAFDKLVKVCCKGSTTLTVGSIPAVLSGATPASTTTQTPTVQTANLIIERQS